MNETSWPEPSGRVTSPTGEANVLVGNAESARVANLGLVGAIYPSMVLSLEATFFSGETLLEWARSRWIRGALVAAAVQLVSLDTMY